MPLTASSNLSFATPEITLSTLPIGGVIKPIEQLMINMTPK